MLQPNSTERRVMRCTKAVALGLLLAVMTPAARVWAVTKVCVTQGDSAGLAQALGDAEDSGLDTEIDVEQGTYVVPPTHWIFTFNPRQDVSLLGGFVPGTSCQQRSITASPNTPSTNTVLDGQSQNGAFIALGLKVANPDNAPYGTFTFEGFELR